VIQALAVGARDAALAGQTLHLVDPEPVTAADSFDVLAHEYCGRRSSYQLPPALVQAAARFRTFRDLVGGAPRESIRYLNHPVQFDTRVATDALAAQGVRCPRLEEYVGPLVRFFREHEEDPAYAP
jgi:hypothetical protein